MAEDGREDVALDPEVAEMLAELEGRGFAGAGQPRFAAPFRAAGSKMGPSFIAAGTKKGGLATRWNAHFAVSGGKGAPSR